MGNYVIVFPDDEINVSVTGVYLSHGSTIAPSSASVTGHWGTSSESATGSATATFVSRTDSRDSFTFTWTLGSNTGTSRTVGSPTVSNLDALDNIGQYYLQTFVWRTQGQYGRSFYDVATYTAADNAGSVNLNPDPSYQGIYQYGVDYAAEGTTARFMIVDPTATNGEIRNYTITGVDGADLSTPLSGTLTFSLVNAYINITPSIDNASDTETLYLNIDGFAPRAITINNAAALIPSTPGFEADANGYQELINNGNVIFDIPTLATGMTWSYSVDQGANWIAGGATSGRQMVRLPDAEYAAGSILVRTVDSNGIASVSAPNTSAHTVDQTAPSSVSLQIAEDSGQSTDNITSDGLVNLSGIEANARWFYSLDNVNWIQGAGSSVQLTGDGAKLLRVKQIDLAGNTSESASISLTLDSTTATPTLTLLEDSGDSTDGITRSGRVNITGIETGAQWFYSLDSVNWLPGVGNSLDLVGDGNKSLQIKQIDLAGNTSEISSLQVTLDSSAVIPGLNLQEDTGQASDWVTRNGRVNITGIENGATWFYSLNNIDWYEGVGDSVDLIGNGSKSLHIKQIDLAGNTSEVSSVSLTLDSTVQQPILSLHEDSGDSADRITRNGRVNISGLETGASWQYSLDGMNWLPGSGNSISLSGDGTKSLWIKQTDLAGNNSVVSAPGLSFNLDTTVSSLRPVLIEDSGASNDFITRNGLIEIQGLESGANWFYSLDNINWQPGLGYLVEIRGDGSKSIGFKQVDQAGNTSEIETLNFVLDTAANDPVLTIYQSHLERTNTVSGFAAPNSLIHVSVDGAKFSTTSNSDTGAWEIDLFSIPNVSGNPLLLSRGRDVLIEAVIVDQAGNISEGIYKRVIPHFNTEPESSVRIETYSGNYLPGDTIFASGWIYDQDSSSSEDMESISYQWQANGVDIPGAGTSRYYIIREADIGKSIRAIASYVDDQGTFEQVVSKATDSIKKRNSYPTGKVSIEGLSGNDYPYTITNGQTLTAQSLFYDLDGIGPISYEWYVNGAPVAGATSDRFLVTQDISNKMISVAARYTDLSGNSEIVYSSQDLVRVEPSVEPKSGSPSPQYVAPEAQTVVTYQFPVNAIQSIGLSPDGQSLLIKIGGVTSVVSKSGTLDFSDGALTTEQLAMQMTPVPVFRSSGGSSGYTLPEVFTGPASLGLQYQLIETADNAVVVGGTTNDFIKVSSTNSIGKAVDGGGGSDVIDGGVGSTFVSGGVNHFGSTFFLDGRASGTSWSTITDFELGSDKATIWGWRQGVSRVSTSFTDFNSGGAEGFKGLTLHFENLLPDEAGSTQTNPNLNSITLTGFTLSDFGASSISELNAQITAGTSKNFQIGSVSDVFGDHGYLLLS